VAAAPSMLPSTKSHLVVESHATTIAILCLSHVTVSALLDDSVGGCRMRSPAVLEL
jgi:hypothetical protein